MRHALWLLILSIYWASTAFAQPNPGDALVTDTNAGINQGGALFSVNQATGDRVEVSDFGNIAQGPLGVTPRGVTLEDSNSALVIDRNG